MTGDTQSASVWVSAKLKDLCHEITVGYVGPMALEYVEDGIPFLRSQNVQPFKVDLSSVKFISPEFDYRIKKSVLKPGDVVVVRTGNAGIACVVPPTLPHANCSDLVIFRPGEYLDSYYLVCLFNSTWGQGQVAGTLVGLAQQHFNIGAAKELVVELPPLSIQREITNILSTWDHAIDLTTQLIATKHQYKQGLMQQLLTGRKRFPAFRQQKWSPTSFGQIFHTKSVRNIGSHVINPITVGKYAIRPQNEHFKRVVASDNLENYNIIEQDDFVYDPMSAYYGAFGRYERSEPGIVSPVYRVLQLNPDYDSDFVKHFIKSHYIAYQLSANSSQGNREGKRRTIQEEAFNSISFKLPDIDEQRAIAKVLNACDQELVLLHRKLELLKKQKQGLMQQLLTGKVRVKT